MRIRSIRRSRERRERKRKALRIAVAIVAPCAAIPLQPSTAGAIANDVPSGCQDQGNGHGYYFSGTWPSATRAAAKAGIEEWNAPKDYEGSSLFAWQEQSSGSGRTYVHLEDLGNDLNGQANCFYDTIKLNSTLALSWVGDVARHEAGHIMALPHSGLYESHDPSDAANGRLVTMGTCAGSLSPNRAMTQDDVGALNFSHTRHYKSAISANFGFEDGMAHWRNTGGTLQWSSSGGAGNGGPRYQPASVGGSYLYQQMNYVDAPGKTLQATGSVKLEDPSHSGAFTIEAWARNVWYGSNPTCDYPNQLNMNVRDAVHGWVMQSSTSNEWATSDYWMEWSTAPWDTASNGNFDLEVRFVPKAVQANNSPAFVRVDNLRIECAGQQSEGDCTYVQYGGGGK